jgi:hypothetical protein
VNSLKLNETLRNRIQENALRHIRQQNIEKRTNLHIHDEILRKGEVLKAAALRVPIERDTAFVFVDHAPQCNWAHPCEYYLYDVMGKLYQKVPASLPPERLALSQEVTAFHSPVKLIDTKKIRASWKKRLAPVSNALSSAPGERYAILFAGKAENRHTNDLEFLYRTLIDVYGFNAANIHVLNHDGTVNYFLGNNTAQTIGANLGNWPGDHTAYRMQVSGQGTRAGFQAALNTIAGQIRPEDFLFIHTNNHGGGPCDPGVNDYCMFVYDANGAWVPYYVNDFIADLGALPRFEVLMIMMEQCRSGGFINPIINAGRATWNHVATAVSQDDYSQGGANFDPFAEDWIAGINGTYPDGTGLNRAVDTSNDGRISANEAFTYADAVHHYDGTVHRRCPPPNGTPLRIGDTPTFSDSPGGYGAYIFLGLPAHDLYVRDNLEDHGREPLIGGGISCSPDIIVYNQELLDPEATLGSPAAQQSDTLGESVEYGQDNFIYIRIQNRGRQPTDGNVTLHYANASTLPTPNAWTQIGDPVHIPAVAPQEMKIVGPLVWKKDAIPAKGHYCFVALVNSGDDPAPDPASIHTVDDYYRFIRESNNATWKNFNVEDMFVNSLTNMSFEIQGWPGIKLSADLMIDLSELPTNVEATLKILKRLTSTASLEHARLLKESTTHQQFALTAGKKAFLRKINLKASDSCQTTLQITIPDRVPDGNYRLAVAQIVDGKEMGRVTQMLAVGQYPYMANRNTREVHVAGCDWAGKISRRNKEAYQDLERALKHGYDGCHYCQREYSKD